MEEAKQINQSLSLPWAMLYRRGPPVMLRLFCRPVFFLFFLSLPSCGCFNRQQRSLLSGGEETFCIILSLRFSRVLL